MLALRHLNGPQAGQVYMLNDGHHKMGRGSNCQIQVQAQGISKEHLEIQVSGSHIVIIDLKSSNGSFLNGTKVSKSVVKVGDRISVDKFIFDLIKISDSKTPQTADFAQQHHQQAGVAPSRRVINASNQLGGDFLKDKINNYLESVVFPGVYQLVEVFDFRAVIFGFSVVFIFLVTFLSLIPMNQITQESVKIESMRRAQTVARALANSNEKAIRTGEISYYSSDLVLKDDGITNVYILGKDGSVIAPPEMAGMTVKDLARFVTQIKGQSKEMSSQLGDGRIAASAPILVYDAELQQNVAKAHAVVMYDPGYLKYDDGRAFSLFIQILIIALIIGAGIFFLMYKLIEHPFKLLNTEIDGALREGRDHAVIKIKLPILQHLLVTVNSLLNRIVHSGSNVSSGASLSETEWMNLVQLVGYPAILFSKDARIVSLNPGFEQLTGVQFQNIQNQPLEYIPDQALKKNCQALINVAQANSQVIHQDRLEFGGQFYGINCQAVTTNGEAQFYLITLTPQAEISGALNGGAA